LLGFGNKLWIFPEEFIDTPEWEGIMKMAKEVLDAFNYKN